MDVEELARTAPRKDPGFDGARSMDYQASATLAIGDVVFAHARPLRSSTPTSCTACGMMTLENSATARPSPIMVTAIYAAWRATGMNFLSRAWCAGRARTVGHLRLVSGAGPTSRNRLLDPESRMSKIYTDGSCRTNPSASGGVIDSDRLASKVMENLDQETGVLGSSPRHGAATFATSSSVSSWTRVQSDEEACSSHRAD